MSKKKICVVTGSRAEYGLLYWLLHEVRADRELELQLAVTGTHLSPEFGMTGTIIEQDGFHIDARIEMLLSSDSTVGIAKSVGLGVIGFADAFDRLRPDVVVVLGDRYEILAAAQAAMFMKIPIAHIHGGETTEGAIDEAIRHALSKMAQIHFVAAEPYRRRVIQMGENPRLVFNVGAIGLDHLHRTQLLDRAALENALGFSLGSSTLLVTYHPVTLSDAEPGAALEALFQALDRFPEEKVVFTKPNSDSMGRLLGKMIDEYVAARPERCTAFTSLGSLRYMSLLKYANAVIGNSSSALIEAPALKTPTVNIGDRQKGRLKADSVIDCGEGAEEIERAIRRAKSAEFKARLEGARSPYGDGSCSVSVQIKNILKGADLRIQLAKKFFDIPVEA
jgi:UDP-N-acetylglucosamine 2-epimerase (non-hydrolysing)/GDP/UDP-N,N'-diacetylbacillosamine 2-epimerase (hydrolysing)